MWQKRLKQILVLVSVVSFVSSTAFGAVNFFTSNPQEKIDNAKKATEKSREEQLQGQLRGYELVLQREPENQAALEGIVQLRLKINDLSGVVVPLEKLVQLNPKEESYKLLLAEVKKRVGETNKKVNNKTNLGNKGSGS